MTSLTSEQRSNLPRSAFAIPSKRKYPIDTKNRARNALSRVSQFGTASEKRQVRNAVSERYPTIASRAMSRSR